MLIYRHVKEWLEKSKDFLFKSKNLVFNLLFPMKEEKKADYYDRHYSKKQSTARYEEIYAQVGEWCKDKRVLDIGCGAAPLQKYVSDYHGFDFSEKAVKAAGNPNVWVANAYEQEPYRGSYDTYVALEVVEHLQDLLVIENIPQGKEFIFSVPSFTDPAHLRTYTEESMRVRFSGALEVQEIIRFNSAKGWRKGIPDTDAYILLVRTRKM